MTPSLNNGTCDGSGAAATRNVPETAGRPLVIAQLLPSLDIGGMERLAVDLAHQQVVDGHRAFIYCTRHLGQLAPEAEANGASLRAFGKADGPSWHLVTSLARRLREDRVDVLHAHNALVLHYGLVAARLAGATVVVNTRHGGNMNFDPKCERIWRVAARWADGVVFVSEGVRDFYVEKDRLTLSNSHVIYNGIGLSRFLVPKVRHTGSLARFRFGAVGRLVPAKDHLTLVRAFAHVAKHLPESELHLLGDGPCRESIAKAAAELGVADRVVLHGAGYNVPEFLASLDAFVLSSIDEGLPISLMEAMAAGLPVISTRLRGFAELAPESVVAGYCEPGQPDALANLMLTTARRADLDCLGEKARRWSQRFGIEESWLKYQALFRQLLTTKGVQLKPERELATCASRS
jgi:glycosyltransferase involved in cell wall biosynthesis